MRYIADREEPELFRKWASRNSKANWSDFSASTDEEVKEIYNHLRETLISQQKQMCCYCEIALIENIDAHIEHLMDKDNFPKKKFQFDNLLASCQYHDSCGHAKENKYFEGMLSPLDEECQSKFSYTGNGRIIAVDESDEDAEKTIKLLDLNCKRLVDRRKSIITTLEYSDKKYLQSSLDHCVEWYHGFYTLIEYLRDVA